MTDLTEPTHTSYGIRVETDEEAVVLSLVSFSQVYSERLTRSDAKRLAHMLLLASDGIEFAKFI